MTIYFLQAASLLSFVERRDSFDSFGALSLFYAIRPLFGVLLPMVLHSDGWFCSRLLTLPRFLLNMASRVSELGISVPL